MVLTGLNQFKPGKTEFMPASGINLCNFSRFKPWFKPDGLNHLPTLLASSRLFVGSDILRVADKRASHAVSCQQVRGGAGAAYFVTCHGAAWSAALG